MDLYSGKITRYIANIEKKYNKYASHTEIINAICLFCPSNEIILNKILEYKISDDRLEIVILNMLILDVIPYYNLLLKIKKINEIELINKYGELLLINSENNFTLFNYIIQYINSDILKKYIINVWESNNYNALNNFEKISNGSSILLFINSEQVILAFQNKYFELLEKYIKVPHNIICKNLKSFIDLSLKYDDGTYLSWLINNISDTIEFQYYIINKINESNYNNYKLFKLLLVKLFLIKLFF